MARFDSLEGHSIKNEIRIVKKETINTITKNKINALAKIFYSMQGYTVKDGYDFSVATHPQEKGMWNQAIVAWAILKDEKSVIKYQI